MPSRCTLLRDHLLRTLTAATLAVGLGIVGTIHVSADPRGDRQGASTGTTDPALLALITNDDVFSTTDLTVLFASSSSSANTNGTQHYGPYASSSPDSGTCGNDWATDTFDRHFTVRTNSNGTFTVVEQFKNGSFTTNTGPSPGACDTTDGTPPGTIVAGKTGSMHGYFIIPLPAGTTQTSTSSACVANMPSAPCTTADFINSHFAPACYPAICSVTTYFFHYTAGDQSLVFHEWKNASTDRGGNHGDIASSV